MCRCAGIYPIRRLDCCCGSPIPIYPRPSRLLKHPPLLIRPVTRDPRRALFPHFPQVSLPSLPRAHAFDSNSITRFSSRTLPSPHEFSPPQCHRRLEGRGWGKKSVAVRENPSPIPDHFPLALKRLFRNDSRMIFNSLRGVCKFIFSFCGGERGSA